MAENVKTVKQKDTKKVVFVVNKRSTYISETKQVKIKAREKDYMVWDDKLTLEFNGSNPSVKSIHIERVDVPTI